MHNTLDDSVWTVTTYAQKKWYILLLTVLCLAEWSLFLHKPNLFLFPPIQIFSVLRSSNGEIQTDFAKRLFWVSYFWRKLPSSSFVPQFSRDWIFVWEKIRCNGGSRHVSAGRALKTFSFFAGFCHSYLGPTSSVLLRLSFKEWTWRNISTSNSCYPICVVVALV